MQKASGMKNNVKKQESKPEEDHTGADLKDRKVKQKKRRYEITQEDFDKQRGM